MRVTRSLQSPSRAALLTGLHPWQLEHAGTHASYFDPKYVTFPEQLARHGYIVGYTGKGWGPGNFEDFPHALGRHKNPAGSRYNAPRDPHGHRDYASAFADFLAARPHDQPFCFWFGSHDPHRAYEKGAGLAKGKRLDQAEVPEFLPDTPEIRSDLLDYAWEIERFDDDLGEILKLLAKHGEAENTLVIVTSDNGCPFPRAKANCYEFGIHMPLAIRWPNGITGGQTDDTLVSFVDLTATLYDVTNVPRPTGLSLVGRSITHRFDRTATSESAEAHPAVFAGRERHSSSRYHSLGYPQRCIRTRDHLYIRNFRPERWPAGTPQKYDEVTFEGDGTIMTSRLGPPHGGYHDIDSCPSLDYLIAHRDQPEIANYLELAVGLRPAEELYAIKDDPACLKNLAPLPSHRTTLNRLRRQLTETLLATGDRRLLDGGDVWETYPRVSGLRWFPVPSWVTTGQTVLPRQDWLEARRPRP